MDPLSIAASACGIAALCGTIVSKVTRFLGDVQTVPETLNEFKTSISALQDALNKIDCIVSKKPKQLLFAQKQERKHLQDVQNVLGATNNCLYKLHREIPEAPTDNIRIPQQARIQLELSLKSNAIIQIRGHIASYTQILQLSLITLSLYAYSRNLLL